MLKIYVRHGMLVENIHESKSLKQSRWLKKYFNFNTQKRNRSKNDFEKDFHRILNYAAFGKTLENVRNRLRSEFIEKDDFKNKIRQQSKLTFNGILKSYENCNSYTFIQSQVVMDKALYVDFTNLELKKLHLYETYQEKLQPYFGQENLQLHYIDTGGMILSMNHKTLSKILKI